MPGRRRAARIGGGTVLALALAAGLGLPAGAATVPHPPTGPWSPFYDCPVNGFSSPTAPALACTVSKAGSGYFEIGGTVINFRGPGILQGAITQDSVTGNLGWLPALDGNTFSAPPQFLPGGIGRLLGNPSLNKTIPDPQVFAAPMLAGAVGFTSILPVDVTLPLKFHLTGPLLGPNCYIGSFASPIVVNLTSGTTNPPPPNLPITGQIASLQITHAGNLVDALGALLVDNAFAVPAASGCGHAGDLDATIDATEHLPSPAGANTVELFGNIALATAAKVAQSENDPNT
jgi:hypothetical protein